MSGLIVESTIRAAVHVGSSKIPSKIAKSSAALFTAFGGSKPALPDLPYDYGALARTLPAVCSFYMMNKMTMYSSSVCFFSFCSYL
jgi:hypothetical protein